MSVDTQLVPSQAYVCSQVGEAQDAVTVSAEMVKHLLPEFDQVSITLVEGSADTSTYASAGGVVTELDRLQYGLGQGPCIDSLRDAAAVVAPHIRQDARWPAYVDAARRLGLRSQVAIPVRRRKDRPMGALNLYSTARDEITPTAPMVAEAIASQVAGALTSLREIEQLKDALATRRAISAAVGMLMAQHRLTESAAFTVLRRRSSFANLKLRTIAEQMVAEADATGLELPERAFC